MDNKTQLGSIRNLHTLGPAGTNCERAAKAWFEAQGIQAGNVVLYNTLEEAVSGVKAEEDALMGCVVYPKLHEIVFQNHPRLELADCLIIPTYDMICAARKGTTLADIKRACSHPAPAGLLEGIADQVDLCDSNSRAAILCSRGEYDACITTRAAAEACELEEVRNFGAVSMGFTVHKLVAQQ